MTTGTPTQCPHSQRLRRHTFFTNVFEKEKKLLIRNSKKGSKAYDTVLLSQYLYGNSSLKNQTTCPISRTNYPKVFISYLVLTINRPKSAY